MAARQPPCYPKDSLPPAILGQYYKLTAKQRVEQRGLDNNIDRAKRELFEKHANEKRRFWADLPQSHTVAAVNRTGAPSEHSLSSQGSANVPTGLHHTTRQPTNIPQPTSSQTAMGQSAQHNPPSSDRLMSSAAQSTQSSKFSTKPQTSKENIALRHQKPQPITKIQNEPAKPPSKALPQKGGTEIVDLVSSSDDDVQLPHVDGKCKATASLAQPESRARRPATTAPAPGPRFKKNHADKDKRLDRMGSPVSSLKGSHTFTSNRTTQRDGAATSQAFTSTQSRSQNSVPTRNDVTSLPAPPSLLTPPSSQISARKRKTEHNISDDSDSGSNFEPSSNDDEPLITRSRKYPAKKIPTSNQPSSSKSSVKRLQWNLKNVVTPKFAVNQPTTPKSTPRAGTLHSAPKSNSAEEIDPSSIWASPSVQAAARKRKRKNRIANLGKQRLGQRAAKRRAIERLEEHCQQGAGFFNDEDIRQADDLEQRLKASAQAAGESVIIDSNLRAMSLVSTSSETTQTQRAASDFHTWTKNRMGGDRYLSKSTAKSRQELLKDSPSPDASFFRCVDGRYFLSKDVEEMDLTCDA